MDAQKQDFAADKKIKKEKIGGKIYLMASPSGEHINVQDNLNTIFNVYFKQNKRRCRAMNDAPLYVDENNFYEPDVKVLCRETRSDDIPVIAVEVLSKSTRDRDTGIKLKEYAKLKIKEYWIIDLKYHAIDIYLLGESQTYEKRDTYTYYPPGERDEEENEAATEFSPVSFPELIVKLEDVFDIFE